MWPYLLSNLTLYPTISPIDEFISNATLYATEIAAILRGKDIPIFYPFNAYPPSIRNYGIFVVFPDPVSAIMIKHEYYSTQYNISLSKSKCKLLNTFWDNWKHFIISFIIGDILFILHF